MRSTIVRLSLRRTASRNRGRPGFRFEARTLGGLFLGGVGVRISISVYVLLVIRDCEFQGERLPVPDRNHALIWMRATVNVPVWFCLYASSRFGFV